MAKDNAKDNAPANTPQAGDNGNANGNGAVKNPLFDIFEAVTFAPARSSETQERKDGLRSKRLASCTITMRGGNFTMHGSIYYKVPKVGPKYFDLTFFGTQFQSSITPVDAQGKAWLQEFRDHYANEFKALYKKNPAAWQGASATVSAGAATADDVDIKL